MKYLSVCSGIEAATVAWHPLGWTPTAFSEIEPFPSAVLAHHYPNVPNLGDLNNYENWKIKEKEIDILVGGTPCQSFSVAGLREGMADPRGNLALVFCGLADKIKPKWICWENVPGVLSSGQGRDFGSLIGALGEIGYGYAWRVLDSQFIRTQQHPRAVPQRRRRVFLVGYLGDWRPPASVLFEQSCLHGNSPPSRTPRKITTTCSSGSLEANSSTENQPYNIVFNDANGTRKDRPNGGAYINPTEISTSLTLAESDTKILAYRKSRRAQSVTDHETWVEDGISNTLNQFDVGDIRDTHAVVQPISNIHAYSIREDAKANTFSATPTDVGLTVSSLRPSPQSHHAQLFMAQGLTVRRLTPKECERLQGFPDNYTQIPYKGKLAENCPDGMRYKALGNSMAVNCMEWIGERIQQVSTTLKETTL